MSTRRLSVVSACLVVGVLLCRQLDFHSARDMTRLDGDCGPFSFCIIRGFWSVVHFAVLVGEFDQERSLCDKNLKDLGSCARENVNQHVFLDAAR